MFLTGHFRGWFLNQIRACSFVPPSIPAKVFKQVSPPCPYFGWHISAERGSVTSRKRNFPLWYPLNCSGWARILKKKGHQSLWLFTFHGRRGFAEVIWVKDLELGNYPNCLGGPNVVIRVLRKGKEEEQKSKKHYDNRSRDGRAVATSQGVLEASRSWRRLPEGIS